MQMKWLSSRVNAEKTIKKWEITNKQNDEQFAVVVLWRAIVDNNNTERIVFFNRSFVEYTRFVMPLSSMCVHIVFSTFQFGFDSIVARTFPHSTSLLIITRIVLSNEYTLYIFRIDFKVLLGKFIHAIWIYITTYRCHLELKTCTSFFFISEWIRVCVMSKLRFFWSALFFRFFFIVYSMASLATYLNEFECIHVSNSSLILPRIWRCIVGFGLLCILSSLKNLCVVKCA